MQFFTMKQMELLSGIKAPTLRVWEKRYGLIEPGRSDGKQRVYTNENLREILQVVYLYRHGLRISRIATLKKTDNMELPQGFAEKAGDFAITMPLLMNAALSLDEQRLSGILNELVRERGLEAAMLSCIYPFLEIIGRAWVTGTVAPNNEHFVSHIITRKIVKAIDELEPVTDGKKLVLLFQPHGEYHEIPLLFVHYLFRKYGWRTAYFGSNQDYEVLQEYCRHKRPTHVYYHLVTLIRGKTAEQTLDEVCRHFPDQVVMTGGLLTPHKKAAPNLRLLESIDALRRLIKEEN